MMLTPLYEYPVKEWHHGTDDAGETACRGVTLRYIHARALSVAQTAEVRVRSCPQLSPERVPATGVGRGGSEGYAK